MFLVSCLCIQNNQLKSSLVRHRVNGKSWLGDHGHRSMFHPSCCAHSGYDNAVLDLEAPVTSSVGVLWGMILGNILGRLADPSKWRFIGFAYPLGYFFPYPAGIGLSTVFILHLAISWLNQHLQRLTPVPLHPELHLKPISPTADPMKGNFNSVLQPKMPKNPLSRQLLAILSRVLPKIAGTLTTVTTGLMVSTTSSWASQFYFSSNITHVKIYWF